MMWGNGYGYGYGGMWFGWLPMILFWIVFIFVVVALSKWIFSGSRHHDRGAGKSALDLLKERYARGEINKEEFDQKKRDLEG